MFPSPRRLIPVSSIVRELAVDAFKFDENFSIQKGRKRCGKRRNCSLRAISPLTTEFSKDMHTADRQKHEFAWDRVIAGYQHFLFFSPAIFSILFLSKAFKRELVY